MKGVALAVFAVPSSISDAGKLASPSAAVARIASAMAPKGRGKSTVGKGKGKGKCLPQFSRTVSEALATEESSIDRSGGKRDRRPASRQNQDGCYSALSAQQRTSEFMYSFALRKLATL